MPVPSQISALLTALVLIRIDAAPQGCDLKAIFQTPKRNYDKFEILERSNFGGDGEEAAAAPTHASDCPRSFANAQVLLRFGEPGAGKAKPPVAQNHHNIFYHAGGSCGCPCGAQCQCRSYLQHPNPFPINNYPLSHFPATYLPPSSSTTHYPTAASIDQNPFYFNYHPNPLVLPHLYYNPFCQNYQQLAPPPNPIRKANPAPPPPPVQAKPNQNQLNLVVIRNEPVETTHIVNNHPKILQPVQLSNEIETVESETAVLDCSTTEKSEEQTTTTTVDGCETTTNAKVVEEEITEENCGTEEKTTEGEKVEELSPTTSLSTESTTTMMSSTATGCDDDYDGRTPNISALVADALVPVISGDGDQKPKLLVTYPVISNHRIDVDDRPKVIRVGDGNNRERFTSDVEEAAPSPPVGRGASLLELLVPRIVDELIARGLLTTAAPPPLPPPPQRPQYKVAGYKIASTSSGYYSDPVKTIIYKQPTILSVLAPKPPYSDRVALPIPFYPEHGTSSCKCPSCAPYEGELNEYKKK